MASLLHPSTWRLSSAPKHDKYDFIVIGGGSAGCAIAGRLSEDRAVSVLLLEAGGNGLVLDARIPAACGKLQHTELDWEEYCEPQPGRACTSLIDGRSFWPRGKGLGGSSLINYMAYVRGAPEDFDSWAKLVGDNRWSWQNVLPVMKRMEKREFDEPGTHKPSHGEHGPLSVSIRQPVHATAKDFVQAASKIGQTVNVDYNGPQLTNRVGLFQQTIRNGERWSAADAYIYDNLHRPNLEVVCNALVQRVLFKRVKDSAQPVAYAVEYSLSDGAKRIVEVRNEIIVSSSSVGSPALLMRSGIGAKPDLTKVGIECIVDNPNVGRNLEDHVFLPILVACKKGKEHVMKSINKATAENMPGALPALIEWAQKGTGPLASPAYDATHYFKTDVTPESPLPDGQIGIFVSPANADLFQNNLRMADMAHHPPAMMADNGEGFILVCTLLHPHSKGYIELKSKDAKDSPRIFANYFVDARDLEALAKVCLRGVEIVKKMEMGGDIHVPADLKHLPVDSIQLWKEMAKRYATTLYHPSSTCRMGSVTNSDLTVKGVRGLRVADASVMPHLTSGNTNCPSIMIGEMCADIVAQQYKLSLGGPQPANPGYVPSYVKLAAVLGVLGIARMTTAKL